MQQKNEKSLKKESQEKPSFRRRVFVFFFNLFLISVVCVAGYVGFVYMRMPSLDSILHERRLPTIVFLDDAGNEIRSSNRIMGTPVTVETLPPHV